MTCPPNWIRINVGGKVFQTSKQTISREPGSFLARLAGEDQEIPSQKDESGAILIDRDPEYFQVILNFLRTGRLVLPANILVEQLMEEADFYGIPALYAAVEDLQKQTKPVESAFLRYVPGSRYTIGHFKLLMTTVDEAPVEELKSTRCGLDIEEIDGGHKIKHGFGVEAWRVVRDCFLNCGYKLVKESPQEWEFGKA
ncbi:BTB/POZ domain-containing protein KCTD17 [Aphelenchoides avenae]|nr:BTB/POZ domain-containing protein KCTD17 [Aphelenchus avenae]